MFAGHKNRRSCRNPNIVGATRVSRVKRYRRVVKAVYGMNEAPRKWWRALTEMAKALRFTASLLDPCLLIKCLFTNIVLDLGRQYLQEHFKEQTGGKV